eukprot:Skav213642  [mRNA]  locus=scaffold2012:186106:187077:- [translate_table: standard]
MALALHQRWLRLINLYRINLGLEDIDDILLLFRGHLLPLRYGVDVGNIVLCHGDQSCWHSPTRLEVSCVSVSPDSPVVSARLKPKPVQA